MLSRLKLCLVVATFLGACNKKDEVKTAPPAPQVKSSSPQSNQQGNNPQPASIPAVQSVPIDPNSQVVSLGAVGPSFEGNNLQEQKASLEAALGTTIVVPDSIKKDLNSEANVSFILRSLQRNQEKVSTSLKGSQAQVIELGYRNSIETNADGTKKVIVDIDSTDKELVAFFAGERQGSKILGDLGGKTSTIIKDKIGLTAKEAQEVSDKLLAAYSEENYGKIPGGITISDTNAMGLSHGQLKIWLNAQDTSENWKSIITSALQNKDSYLTQQVELERRANFDIIFLDGVFTPEEYGQALQTMSQSLDALKAEPKLIGTIYVGKRFSSDDEKGLSMSSVMVPYNASVNEITGALGNIENDYQRLFDVTLARWEQDYLAKNVHLEVDFCCVNSAENYQRAISSLDRLGENLSPEKAQGLDIRKIKLSSFRIPSISVYFSDPAYRSLSMDWDFKAESLNQKVEEKNARYPATAK